MLSAKQGGDTVRLTTFFFYAPSRPNVQPAFIPIVGEFERVNDAHAIALAMATKHRHFKDWCVAFEIEDDNGNIASKWSKDDADRS